MAFSIEEFIRLRPFLYHLTASNNLIRIRRTRHLDSAARILIDAGRPAALRSKRQRHELVQIGSEIVYIRDQAPLHAGNAALSGGWTFEDFVEHLNQKVFFWPGTSRGPISYGLRHYERYRSEEPAIIRVPTTSIFNANKNDDRPPLFCRFNSGSPRCSNGQPSPRSPMTFGRAAQVEFGVSRVVEVAFNDVAALPMDAQIGRAPMGPWTQIW